MSSWNRIGGFLILLVPFVALPGVEAMADPDVSKTVQADGPPDRPAVVSGRVTGKAGEPLADVRIRVVIPATDMRFVDSTTPHRRIETTSNATGDYRLEIEGLAGETKVSLDALKPGHSRASGTLMRGMGGPVVTVAPGAAKDVPIQLERSRYLKGIVVDEEGHPIPAVQIGANAVFEVGTGGVERTSTARDGMFEVFNYSEEPALLRGGVGRGEVAFFHPDYLAHHIDDAYKVRAEERETLRIVLPFGARVSGKVVNAVGRPASNVMVKVESTGGKAGRKAVMTDAEGKFTLNGLLKGPATLSCRVLRIKQKIAMPLMLEENRDDLTVRLELMPLRDDPKSYGLLGMQLADVTPEIREAYDIPRIPRDRGVLILDAGKDTSRLEIGELEPGYVFWLVGETMVGSVREFLEQILKEAAAPGAAAGAGAVSIRVVYSMSTVEFDGTNTQYLKLTPEDLAELNRALETLPEKKEPDR